MMRDAFGRYAGTHARLASPMLVTVAASCLQGGEIDDGLALVDQALDSGRAPLDQMFTAEIWRLKGELLLARDRRGAPVDLAERRKRTTPIPMAPEDCFERALAISREQGARMLELRAAASLARLHMQRGDASGARDRLAAIVATFEPGLHTPNLEAARQLLDDIGRAAPRSR